METERSGDEATNEPITNAEPINEKPTNHDEDFFEDAPPQEFDNNDNDDGQRFQQSNRGNFR